MADRVVSYVFRGDIKGLQASMSAASASVGKLANDLTSADKESAKFRKGLTTVGATAGKVGLVAAAGLGAVVLASANFDKAMSEVKAATSETADNMDKLREAAIQAGADTAYSASEAADGITQLAKAGVSTSDILSGGLAGALDLAAAGQIAVGDAAEYTATALTQFQLSGDKASHVADLLAAGAGLAQGEVSDMANALKYAGVPAANLGVSIEETAGTIALFAKNGIIGEQAGTSLRGMFASLTSPSAVAAKQMEKLGISVFDASGNFIGLDGVADQLHTRLGDLTQAERANALGRIFGNEQLQAANVLYREGGDAVREWTGNVDQAGFAADQAATKMDNLAGDFEQLKGSLETALIGAGDGAQGPLRKLVQGATDAVNVFNDMPSAVQGTATALLGITAVTGGGLWFGAKVIQGVSDTRQALKDLGWQAGKAKGALRGIGSALVLTAVYEGLDLLLNKLDDIRGINFENLDRSVTALSQGRWVGNLDEVANHIYRINSGADKVTNTLFGWAPGNTAVESAEKNLSALDDTLAGMVESGRADEAAAAFERITAAAGQAPYKVDPATVMATFDQYRLAVANANGAMSVGQAVMSPFATAMGLVGDAAKGTAGDIDSVAGAMADTTAEAYTLDNAMKLLFGKVDVDAALVSWKSGLAGLKAAIKDNAKTLDVNTQAGRDNRDAIRGNVNDLRSWAEAVYNQTGSVKGLETRLLKGRDAIIEAGKAANISQADMEAYLKELGLTPKEIRTDVRLMGTQEAVSAVSRLIGMYAGIPRYIETQAVTRHTDKFERQAGPALATGGRVSGPGTATSDSIPAYLSDGEYVVKAAAVAKYGARFFDDVNAMRFADGGAVYRAQRAASSYSTVNNYGHSGPMQISGRLRMDDGRMADITGVVDDRIAANARQDRATGRRR